MGISNSKLKESQVNNDISGRTIHKFSYKLAAGKLFPETVQFHQLRLTGQIE